MATHHRPLHALLGGGAFADLRFRRSRNTSVAAVAGATLVWFLFERAGYSLPSVLSNVLLLVVTLFFWAKSSSMLNRLEVALLLIVYIAYGYTKGGSSSFILLTISSWFMVISWLFAPYIFNPCGFEWQK